MGFALELSLVVLNSVTQLNRTSTLLEPTFVLPYSIYLLAVIWVTKSGKVERSATVVVIITAFAVLMSATFLLQTPSLSNDIYRYIWDGKLLLNGVSPYSYPPDASQLAAFRDSNWLLVENKGVISPYPPLAELLNAIVYWISPTVTAFKAASLLPDFASMILLPIFLKKLNLDPRLALIYSWNPLFALEFGSSGHDDPLALFFLLASFYLLYSNRRVPSALALAMATLAKLFPLMIAPLLIKRWGARATTVFVLLIIAFYLPFAVIGGNLLSPISAYVLGNTAIFNGGVFSVLEYLFQIVSSSASANMARGVVYSILLAALAWMLWKIWRSDVDDLFLAKCSAALITVYIALSGDVQPWYLSWVFLPFLTFLSSWAWIGFSVTVFLTYYTFTQPPIQPGYWAEILWVKIVEYSQLYGMMAYELLRHRYLVPRGNTNHSPSRASAQKSYRLRPFDKTQHEETVGHHESVE
jgi:hypothetical protein